MHTKISRVGSFCSYLRRRLYLPDTACRKNRRLAVFFLVFFSLGCGSMKLFAFGWSQKQNKQKQSDDETFPPSRLERKRPSSNDSMLSNTVAAKNIGLQDHLSPEWSAGTGRWQHCRLLVMGHDEQRFSRRETFPASPICLIKFNLPRDT